MTSSIPALLQPMKDRLAAATPGPWEVESRDLSLWVQSADYSLEANLGYVGNHPHANAYFIAAAPAEQAKLIAAIEAVAAFHETVWAADPNGGGSVACCRTCLEYSPCKTAAALTQALGGDTA